MVFVVSIGILCKLWSVTINAIFTQGLGGEIKTQTE